MQATHAMQYIIKGRKRHSIECTHKQEHWWCTAQTIVSEHNKPSTEIFQRYFRSSTKETKYTKKAERKTESAKNLRNWLSFWKIIIIALCNEFFRRLSHLLCFCLLMFCHRWLAVLDFFAFYSFSSAFLPLCKFYSWSDFLLAINVFWCHALCFDYCISIRFQLKWH